MGNNRPAIKHSKAIKIISLFKRIVRKTNTDITPASN